MLMKTKQLYILIFLIVTLNCSGQQGNSLTYELGLSNSDGYNSSTIVFSAINVTFTTFNVIRIVKPDKHKSNAVFGILFGSVQTMYGVFNSNSTDKNANIFTSVNIGLGLTTIATSIIRLATKNPPKESKVTFNFFYLPPIDHHTATAGISLVGRIN